MAKEETASNKLLDLVAWIDAHLKQVLIGAAIAVVVIGGAILFFYQQGKREAHASEALSEVRVPQTPSGALPSGTAESYLEVAKSHPGTKAAARAVMEAAGVYHSQARYADAQKQYERIAREFPESPWQAEAAIGVAASLEAQGKTNEAIAKYEELRKRYANSPVVDTAKLNTARMLEDSKPAEALKLYEELMKIAQANPYNSLGNEAGLRMEELLKAHPELAKTNAPPPAITQIQPGQTGAVQTITLSNFAQNASNAVPGSNMVITLTNPPQAQPQRTLPNTNVSATTNRTASPTGNSAGTNTPQPNTANAK